MKIQYYIEEGGRSIQKKIGSVLVACTHTHSHIPDDATLILVVPLHVEVAIICYGKDVRWNLPYLLISVEADLVWSIDW